MDEYVTKQSVLDAFEEEPLVWTGSEFELGERSEWRRLYTCVEAIDPIENVRPVVHGRWIPGNMDGSWKVNKCSVCKKDTIYVRYAPDYDFCPNCGADMR